MSLHNMVVLFAGLQLFYLILEVNEGITLFDVSSILHREDDMQ